MTARHERTLRLPPRWFVHTAWVLYRAHQIPANRYATRIKFYGHLSITDLSG